MSSSSSYASLPLPTLTTKNYDSWCIMMQAFLQGQGVWDHVSTGYTKLDATTIAAMTMTQRTKYDESKQKEGRAKSFLMSVLDDAMLPKIIGASNSKEAWDILQQAYRVNDKVKIVRLQTL